MIDDASVCLTPREECVGIYNELVDRVTALFNVADGFFDLVEPLVIRWRLGVRRFAIAAIHLGDTKPRSLVVPHRRRCREIGEALAIRRLLRAPPG